MRRRSGTFARLGLLPLALLVLLVAVPVLGQGWTNIRLNQDATIQLQNEQQIAINPTDPDNMVTVWRDFRLGFRQVGWAYTFDGGASWAEGGLIPEPNFPWQSDPGITTDKDGNFYAIVLSLVNTSTPSSLYVLKSTDGGLSWGAPMEVVGGVANTFEDKEFLAIDRTDGAHAGNMYVAWSRFPDSANSVTAFRRSTDGGTTWSSTLTLSGTSNSIQFPIPVVGRQGEVYVAWNRFSVIPAIRLKVSTDGGATFGPGSSIATPVGVFHVLDGGVDAYSSPHIDADITDGAFSGRVYCAFMDQRNGLADFDIWLTSTDDQGGNWSTPIRINDDTMSNGRDQFHPWLFVDNLGIVTVVFLDRRHDPSNLTYHCYLTQSTDGGATWTPNARVSNVASDPAFARPPAPGGSSVARADDTRLRSPEDPPQILAGLIGEYIGVVSWNGRPTPIWTDIRNGHQDTFAGFKLTGVGVEPAVFGGSTGRLLVAPNPMRSGTLVRSNLTGPASLRVYDLAGRLVREIAAATASGPATVRWDGHTDSGRVAPAGVYFLQLRSGDTVSRGKVVVVD